jgi:titin
VINIEKFAGLVTNASPYSLPPGAAVTQVNVQCLSPGQLSVRPGMQAYTLSSTVSATRPVVASFSFQHAGGSVIVYQDAVGTIFSGRSTASDGAPSLTGVPSAPLNVTAVPQTSSVALDWDPPAVTGGSDITGYTVQVSLDGGTVWSYALSATASAATAAGLTNGQAYVFRVAATNNYGIGPYSAASASATPVGAPASPTNLLATAANSGASLTWSAPTNNGGSVLTDYAVEYSANAGQAWTVFADGTSTSTSATVTGLTNGQAYVFRVAARNAVGTSAYATYMTPVYPIGVPDQVASLTATHGNAQVTLQWQAPSANNVGGITDYVIQRSTDSGATWSTLSDGTNTDTSYFVTQLTNGTAYQFRVSAVNSVGAGPYSASTGNVTPRTLPGAPTGLTATPGNSQIALSWTAPASNGGAAITDYQIQVSVAGGAYSTVTKSASTATSYTATGLTNGTAYTYRVATVNSEGASAYVTSSSVTPQTVPLAPTNVAGTVGNGSVTVRWSAPTDSGGSVITDYLIQYSTDGTSWTTVSDGTSTVLQTTVAGLTNGISYTFRVAAVSAVGTGNYSTPSSAFIPIGPPGAPTNAAISGGNTQMFASWTPPTSTGGTPITGYVLQYRRSTTTTWTTYGTVDAVLEYTISGLTNGFTYFFRVAAVNAAGTGAYSAESASVVVGQVPAAVSGLTMTSRFANNATTDTTLTLSWTAPNAYGSIITDYVIQTSTASSGPWTVLADSASSSTTATFAGIQALTTYYYRVYAVSTVGAGPPTTTPLVVRIAQAPGIPTITATAAAGYVTLTWPAVAENGAAITGYKLYEQRGATSSTVSGNTLDGAVLNASVDLAARTAVVPCCTADGAFARYNLALSNLAGAGDYGASNTVSVSDGPVASDHTTTVGFAGGACVLDVLWPARGCIADTSTLACDYSTDEGSTWTAVTQRAASVAAYPTVTSGVISDPYRGSGRSKYWIAPVPSSPFVIRSRVASSSGVAVSGSQYVVTSPITSPANSDPLWDRVSFLWDANTGQRFVRSQATMTASQQATSSSANGTGRFGSLVAANVSGNFVSYNLAKPSDIESQTWQPANCTEWWMKMPAAGVTLADPVLRAGQNIVSTAGNITHSASLEVAFTNGAAVVSLTRVQGSGQSTSTLSTVSSLAGQWVHFSFEFTNSGWALFINGHGSRSSTTTSTTTAGFALPDGDYVYITPNVESLRITAWGRYLDRLQAPTLPFWHP